MKRPNYVLRLPTLAAIAFATASGEQWLVKGDSRVLGNQESEKVFVTCGKVRVDLTQIKNYRIKNADKTCKDDDVINLIPREREKIEQMKQENRPDPDRVRART